MRKKCIKQVSICWEKNDFSSFRAAHCQSLSPCRNEDAPERDSSWMIVLSLILKRTPLFYHMVRNITGSLIKVGRGEENPEWIKWLLEAKDRKLAGAMQQKAEGLYLDDVDYPQEFDLPRVPIGSVIFTR
ncbi:hypothetical protein P4S64_07450 [Vibrio sp. M60_M31a]